MVKYIKGHPTHVYGNHYLLFTVTKFFYIINSVPKKLVSFLLDFSSILAKRYSISKIQ